MNAPEIINVLCELNLDLIAIVFVWPVYFLKYEQHKVFIVNACGSCVVVPPEFPLCDVKGFGCMCVQPLSRCGV